MLAPEAKLKFFESAIKEVVADMGYTDISVHFDDVSEFGVNYLGVILKVKVIGTKNRITETLFLVVKAVPDNDMMRKKVRVNEKFHNEATFYNKILPAFEELQKKYNVKDTLKTCIVVKTVSEEYKEMMLMHDLTSPGLDFEQSRIGKVLDLEHTRSVVRNVGKVHALSFATKKYFPGLLERNLSDISDKFKDEMLQEMIKYDISAAISVLEDAVAKGKISDILPALDDYLSDILDHKLVEPYAVLVHGDIWSNNVLFKYEGDTLVESVLLDWQIVRYHSPILDLLFFLFTSVDDDVRAANFQSFLDLYYSTLSECLKDLKCNADELFPRKAFEEHLKKFAKFALIDVLAMLPILAGLPIDPTKLEFSGNKLVGGMPELTDIYKRRVNATLRDLTNNGLF